MAAAPTAGGALGASLRMTAMATPRLRTRLFAARCVLELPRDVGSDPRHLDLIAAQGGARGTRQKLAGDWLVGQLQQLVDVAFKMATGATEALRPLGLALLRAILRHFGRAEDPQLEGARLLDQYQAQFVSALRSALSPGASPTLTAAGAGLAAAFLQAGLATGDAPVLSRLLGLLSAPLQHLEADCAKEEKQYAEWVGVHARVALLQAHAGIAMYAATSSDAVTQEAVANGQRPFLRLLMDKWSSMLADAAVAASGPDIAAAHMPLLFRATSSTALHSVAPYLRRAWPAVLDALTLSIQQDPETAQQASRLLKMQPQLLSICHMAVCDASARLAGPAAAGSELYAASLPEGDDDEEQDDLTAAADSDALLSALAAMWRVVTLRVVQKLTPPSTPSKSAAESASGADSELEAAHDMLGLLLQVTQQVVQPLISMQRVGPPEAISWPAILNAVAGILADTAQRAPASWLADAAFRQALGEAAVTAMGLACPMQATKAGGAAAPLQLDSLPEERQGQLANALSAAFGAATSLLQRSAADDIAAERVLFISVALQVLQTSELPAQTDAAQEFLAAVFAGLGSEGAPSQASQAEHDGLAASVVGNLAAAIEKLADGGSDEAPARLTAVMAAVLSIGAANAPPADSGAAQLDSQTNGHAESFGGGAESQVQLQCLQVLRRSQEAAAAPAVRIAALSALRNHLRATAAATEGDKASQQAWALQAVCEVAPLAALHVHSVLGPTADAALGQTDVQVVAETLKMLLVALTVASQAGEVAQRALLDLLVPLLIEAAAPESAPPSPPLVEVALKLISHLASGASAAGFKSAVASLPPAAKQRLQGALKGLAPGGHTAAPKPAAAAVHKPAIALKNFGMVK